MKVMKLAKPKAILFDWDNTLVDTWPVIHEALKNTFEVYGMTPWTLAEVKQRVARSMRDAFPDLFGAEWEKAGELYKNNYRAIHLKNLKPLPGAEDTLRAAQRTGAFLGVVSNKTGPILRKEVPYLGWQDYFSALVGSGDAEKDKPHAAPILKALEGSGISPGPDVWLVGDSIIDVECTKEAGISAVVYGDLEVDILENGALMVKDYGVAAQAMNHKDLINIIESMMY
jgi:phosphoglycolate phosphatase